MPADSQNSAWLRSMSASASRSSSISRPRLSHSGVYPLFCNILNPSQLSPASSSARRSKTSGLPSPGRFLKAPAAIASWIAPSILFSRLTPDIVADFTNQMEQVGTADLCPSAHVTALRERTDGAQSNGAPLVVNRALADRDALARMMARHLDRKSVEQVK